MGELDEAVEEAARKDAVAQLLQTHPGVGPVTALTFSLTLGQIERFAHSRQVVSYLGLNPAEHSSGGRQRLGRISKQGNPMLRSLLVEAGQTTARLEPELKRAYQRLKRRKHSAVAFWHFHCGAQGVAHTICIFSFEAAENALEKESVQVKRNDVNRLKIRKNNMAMKLDSF